MQFLHALEQYELSPRKNSVFGERQMWCLHVVFVEKQNGTVLFVFCTQILKAIRELMTALFTAELGLWTDKVGLQP